MFMIWYPQWEFLVLIYISTKREVAMMTNTVKEFLAKEGEPALGGGKNSRKVISFYQTHLHHSFHLVWRTRDIFIIPVILIHYKDDQDMKVRVKISEEDEKDCLMFHGVRKDSMEEETAGNLVRWWWWRWWWWRWRWWRGDDDDGDDDDDDDVDGHHHRHSEAKRRMKYFVNQVDIERRWTRTSLSTTSRNC